MKRTSQVKGRSICTATSKGFKTVLKLQHAVAAETVCRPIEVLAHGTAVSTRTLNGMEVTVAI